jgi:hypothetical protein
LERCSRAWRADEQTSFYNTIDAMIPSAGSSLGRLSVPRLAAGRAAASETGAGAGRGHQRIRGWPRAIPKDRFIAKDKEGLR